MTRSRHPLDDMGIVCVIAEHRDEIRAAYWSGQSLDDLAEQWSASLKMILVLAYCDEPAKIRALPSR